MSQEKKFRVIGIQALEEDKITLTLTPIEDKEPRPEEVIRPKFRSEEERIGFEMGMAVIKGMSEMGSRLAPPLGGHAQFLPPTISVMLPKDVYAQIGKPSINSIIVLKVSISVIEP